MISRFEGEDGNRRLIEVLKSCYLVEHNEELAKKLAETGEVVSFKTGETLMTQGADDNDIYFLLVGQVEVTINNRHIKFRQARENVGEMALLSPTEPRSATVTAVAETVALKVSEPHFQRLANEYPHIWKAVAGIVADRLRQRSSSFNTPNEKPILFIGCATESLEIAREIQLGLMHDNIIVMPWTDGVFGPSSSTMDQLEKAVSEADFAAFVFSGDDSVVSRETEFFAPRDNTIFELGLFMGKLERSRTFIIIEQNSHIKIPTDLLGITPLTYVYKEGGDLTTAIAPICTKLRKVITALGVR